MTDEQIITYLGFETASDEYKEFIVDSIRAVVEIRSSSIVEEAMDESQKKEFERLRQQGDDQVIWDWLRENVLGVDMREVYETSLQSYLEESKEEYAKIK